MRPWLPIAALPFLLANSACAPASVAEDKSTGPSGPLTASISVDAAKPIKPVSRGLNGTNVEWNYSAGGMIDPKTGAVRPEITELAREVRLGPVRFPAGIAADFYHWRDGVGPRASRPVRQHGSDNDKSANDFGTDELAAFCRAAGTEPMLTVNIITGTPEEAADWVAYCNREKGYHVRLWEIGNEPYMKGNSAAEKKGHLSAQEYADRFLRFSAAMKKVDPTIETGAVGGANYKRYGVLDEPSWDKTVLERAGSAIDFLSIHNGYAPVIAGGVKATFDEVYEAMMAFPEVARENFEQVNRDIEAYLAPADAARIKLAVTEWGPLFIPRKEEVYLDHSKTMGSALFVASLMQTFLQARRVEMANFFKFIDIAFQGSISSAGEPKPSYYALKMYSRHFGDVLVPAAVESPGFDNKAIGLSEARHNVPDLMATASLSEDKSRLFILAVNRSFTAPVHAKVRIEGFRPADAAKLWSLSAPSLDANNGPDLPNVPGLKWPAPAHAPRNSLFDQGKPGTVTIQEAAFRGAAGGFDLEIPPIAVVSLEMTSSRPASKP